MNSVLSPSVHEWWHHLKRGNPTRSTGIYFSFSPFFFFPKAQFYDPVSCFLSRFLAPTREVRRARGMTAGACPSTRGCLARTQWGFLSLCLLSLCVCDSLLWLEVCMRPMWNDKLAERCFLLSLEHADGRLFWQRPGHPSSWPCRMQTSKLMNPCSNWKWNYLFKKKEEKNYKLA